MNRLNKYDKNQTIKIQDLSPAQLEWFCSNINQEPASNKKLLQALNNHEDFKNTNGIKSKHKIRL